VFVFCESSTPTKRDFRKAPEIKINSSNFIESGFEIGKLFAVVYQPGKITLVLVAKENGYTKKASTVGF